MMELSEPVIVPPVNVLPFPESNTTTIDYSVIVAVEVYPLAIKDCVSST